MAHKDDPEDLADIAAAIAAEKRRMAGEEYISISQARSMLGLKTETAKPKRRKLATLPPRLAELPPRLAKLPRKRRKDD